MKWSEVEKHYGKHVAAAMLDSHWLTGITVKITPDGEADYYQDDLDRAYRNIKGEL